MVICVGEILVDLIAEKRENGVFYGRHAGGAPFNVACGIAKLGGNAGFYGCVGDDPFGKFLSDFAAEQTLGYNKIKKIIDRNTTLALVELEEGERKFGFYRKHTADACLQTSDIPELVQTADILHLGSLPMSEPYGRQFYDELIARARQAHKKISFDVNYRSGLFPDENAARSVYADYAAAADIVKLSDEELSFLTGETDLRRGIEKIADDTKVVFVTFGGKGSACFSRGQLIRMPAMPVRVMDTTGAGDAFFAGVLTVLDQFPDDLERALFTGSACGALTTTQKGAIDAFPSRAELNRFLDSSGFANGTFFKER